MQPTGQCMLCPFPLSIFREDVNWLWIPVWEPGFIFLAPESPSSNVCQDGEHWKDILQYIPWLGEDFSHDKKYPQVDLSSNLHAV